MLLIEFVFDYFIHVIYFFGKRHWYHFCVWLIDRFAYRCNVDVWQIVVVKQILYFFSLLVWIAFDWVCLRLFQSCYLLFRRETWYHFCVRLNDLFAYWCDVDVWNIVVVIQVFDLLVISLNCFWLNLSSIISVKLFTS